MEKDFVELSKKWFDKQAPVYDETNTILYSKYGKISCENIYDFLKDKEYEKLLDIGCGTGYLINMLAKEYDAEFTGLDLSPEMINQAKSKNIKNSTFIEGRSDDLPLKNDTFDVITCSQSFHHYPETDKPMQEARRVLKQEGLYILSDTGVGPFKMLGVRIDDFLYRHFSNTGDCNISYMEKTIKDMERNGFMIVKAEKVTTFIYTVIGKKI
ncbi:MAG: class I SAM-dependent methyltransferase [Clostridia bacterium]|nr:class I SAM-dependent methyltransferase [Clostridia bacterium]